MKNSEKTMEKIVNLCKGRGFEKQRKDHGKNRKPV